MESKCIENYIRFCVDTNIDCMQIEDSVRKFFMAYQRNLFHRGAFKTLFAEAFINWDYIERSLPKFDCTHWLTFFKYIDFSQVTRTKSILQNIEKHLVSLKLDPVRLACPIFLLKNTNFITAQQGVERLFCEHEVDEAYNKSLQFFALSADVAFDMVEMTAVFCHIVQNCKVNVAEIERQIEFVKLKEEELSTSFKVKQIRMVGSRPRLRSKLSEISKEVKSVQNMDNFEIWCQAVGFPSVFSLHIRRKLYFLMSQVHIEEPKRFVPSITQDSYIHKSIQPVNVPDVDVVYKVITSMRLTDEPFKELSDFRCDAFTAFPVTQMSSMTLNDIMFLYVCAYQHPQVWKDVWKQLVPLISHQVVKDVETFRKKNPFNFEAVLKILNN